MQYRYRYTNRVQEQVQELQVQVQVHTLDAAPRVLAHAHLPSVHLRERVAPDYRERPARLRITHIDYCI